LNQKAVKCKNGHAFCFSCSEESHLPCGCKQVKEWKKKCSDDSETTNFILSNTKECPKCQRNIEKNGGCNHMVCSQCKHEFCWICLDKWSIHGTEYYNCNKYKESDDKNKDNISQARQLLEKYMHYFSRYQTHEQSQKFEGKLRSIAQEKMEMESLKHNKGWLDVDYIINGVEQLIECRAVLKWTYVYAYYLPAGPQKELFEYLQQELEHNTENLSELLEGSGFNNKERIISFTKVAQSRLFHLIKGVDDGLQK
jgi:ariadne-1